MPACAKGRREQTGLGLKGCVYIYIYPGCCTHFANMPAQADPRKLRPRPSKSAKAKVAANAAATRLLPGSRGALGLKVDSWRFRVFRAQAPQVEGCSFEQQVGLKS